jgi:hypothetical protein
MWESLTKLYQSDNPSRKMMLREKLGSTKMARGDIVASYLTKFTQIRDELAAIGEAMDETELGENILEWFHQIVGHVCSRSSGTGETSQLRKAMGRLYSGGVANWVLTCKPTES